MSNELITPQLDPTVQSLVDTIRDEIESGKERAYLAMEQEKRTTYWNVGKHIKEHLLQNADRADYGEYLVTELSREVNLSRAILYDCVLFFEQYPEIVYARRQLTWTHIRTLIRIQEPEERQELEKKIADENLTVRELKNLVKSGKTESDVDVKPLPVTRGEPYFYRIKKVQNNTVVDLGFRFFIESPVEMNELSRNGDLIQSQKDENGYQFFDNSDLVVPHYTYKAFVLEVIDGDTLWVNIDLGFGAWTTQKLRLRGINTKAIETAEGKGAKEFMESRLKRCKFIAVKTYWRDKFTRYLADIFYIQREDDFNKIVRDGRFMNQVLLDEGLAARF